MNNHMVATFFGVTDYTAFCNDIQNAVNRVPDGGIFLGDNLITIGRNLGFMDDEPFMTAFNKNAETVVEKAVLWRYHTLSWAAKRTMVLDGDMVECACYRGSSARIIAEYVDFNASGKSFYLYDLFEHDENMPHHTMPEHGSDLYDKVKSRFSDMPKVVVTKGKVPEVLEEIAPEKIAFLHLDLNDAEAEIRALEFFWDRIVPGGSVVLDDYGWQAYRNQKLLEDKFLASEGYSVLELPTGQGLVIK